MRSILVAVLYLFALAFVLVGTARADWPLEKMNKQIEETNVIVSGICSGTVIDVKQRLVLTAYHCVDGNLHEVEKKEIDPKTGEIKTRRVMERLPAFIEIWKRGADYEVISSQKHEAKVVGYDADSDTALLQVTDEDWTPAAASPLAPDTYKYQRGKTVYAVGNPAVVLDNSLSVGIISAPKRKLDFGSGRKIPIFQTTAVVVGGNSGGALYNDDGQMIGTVTGMYRGASISFIVPISYSKAMIEKAGFGSILK